VTISLGASTHLRSHATARSLVDDADKLLYRAKQEGRNRVAAKEHARASAGRVRAATPRRSSSPNA
jgi:hypothetical protein